jgi:hypothetical protein
VTGKVHGYYRRRLAGTPVSGVPVVIELRLRRLVCTSLDCPRQTFREQVPGLAERYAHRTPALAQVVGQVAIALAGRAGAALLAVLGVLISRTAVLGALLALPRAGPPRPSGGRRGRLRRGPLPPLCHRRHRRAHPPVHRCAGRPAPGHLRGLAA